MPKGVAKNHNIRLLELLAERPVVHNVALVRLSGSTIAGIFLSHLLYWWGKGEREWIYKTIPEFQEETGMNRSEQDRAIRIWKKLGILRLENRGIPRRRFFYINLQLLEETLLKELRTKVTQKPAGKSAESSRLYRSNVHAITESTQESTSRDSVLQTVREQTFDFKTARENLSKKLSIKN